MRRVAMLIAVGALSISAAAAQPTSNLADSKSKPTVSNGTALQKNAPSKSCAEYGPGFIRVEGSTSCMRIGGAVSIGAGTSGAGRGR
ncbi:MAG: hypothetical protein BGP05_20640 [Rhizobiales bacterium 62-47]|nr:MAG: hypothetical protein BGP05_20640 [Rhizobiales bacterium 62-47]